MKKKFSLFKTLGVIAGAAGLAYAGYKVSKKVNEKLKEYDITLEVKNLVEELYQKEIAILDFDKVLKGDWNKMYVFTPFTPYDEIFDIIGFEWSDVYSTNVNTDQSINLLVFVKDDNDKKKVVNFMEYPKWYGDFSLLNGDMYYRENAKFELTKEGEKVVIHEKINE